MVKKLISFLSLVKFSHTIFALPFAFIGFFLAYRSSSEQFNPVLLGLMVLCMVFARNAAMGFNRLVDRHFDKKNPRTRNREIPQGVVSPFETMLFVVINSALFIATTYFINTLVFLLSPVALFVILLYSYTKRFTSLCHFVLGLGLALAPVGAYLCVTGSFATLPVLYGFVVMFWVAGFDIIYSIQDERFDRENGLKSFPARFGTKRALFFSVLTHAVVVLIVLLIGLLFHFNLWYWVGAVVFIGLLLFQHIIVKPGDLSRVNLAFASTNGLASILFALFSIIGMLTGL